MFVQFDSFVCFTVAFVDIINMIVLYKPIIHLHGRVLVIVCRFFYLQLTFCAVHVHVSIVLTSYLRLVFTSDGVGIGVVS